MSIVSVSPKFVQSISWYSKHCMLEGAPVEHEEKECISVQVSSLVPIQASGVRYYQLGRVATQKDLPPPEVVRLPGVDGDADRFLLIDGHHRVVNATTDGAGTITVHEITNDNIGESHSLALAGLHSTEEVIGKYYAVWKPLCDKVGVTSVATLPRRDTTLKSNVRNRPFVKPPSIKIERNYRTEEL